MSTTATFSDNPPASTGPDLSASLDTTIQGLKPVPFTFTGSGGEYFRIWIVNLLLTVVTLGVYSAWAKVRNKQYFYGNTHLQGATFSYLADPKKILLGRAIAVAFLLLYVLAEHLSVMLAGIMFLLFLLIFPWVVCRALRFNAVNSAYRNVRFGFRGTAMQAYVAFLLWPIAGLLTFGALMPYAICKQQHFIYGKHRYGASDFSLLAGPGAFYHLFLMLFLTALGLMVAIGVVFGVLFATGLFFLAMLSGVFVGLAYLAMFAAYQVRMANLRYQNIALDDHQMDSNWSMGSYFVLLLTNSLGIVFTLGLFIPWAKVRTARYKAEHTWCLVAGDLDGIVAQAQTSSGSVSEGMSDLFGIDVGI